MNQTFAANSPASTFQENQDNTGTASTLRENDTGSAQTTHQDNAGTASAFQEKVDCDIENYINQLIRRCIYHLGIRGSTQVHHDTAQHHDKDQHHDTAQVDNTFNYSTVFPPNVFEQYLRYSRASASEEANKENHPSL